MKKSREKTWIERTNVYEVNLRQYTVEGTFAAFSRSLPRLRDMGVETLWFMPITPISQKGKKGSLGSYYACSDYTSVNPEFGTLQDWKALVADAHRMGFKVILDWVANHTGWDHRWTVEHPEFYKKEEETGDFKKASGMDDIIELDFSKPALRKAMISAMRFWIEETGIDGFRCDLAFWVALDFWEEAKKALENLRPLFWLAELDSLAHPQYMKVFDAAYTWTWMQATQDFYQKGLPLATLREVLLQYNSTEGMKAWFTTNHDENSWNGTEFEKYGAAAEALAVFSCTYPGIPLIYSGQELPNKKRLQFFEKDVIEWDGSYKLHFFYQTLLGLRTRQPALGAQKGALSLLETDRPEEMLVYRRTHPKGEVVVFLNLSARTVNCTLAAGQLSGSFRNVFTGWERNLGVKESIALNPWGYLVYEAV